MYKKKGFTLIELLAVIVVLAIIAFIAVPMVLDTIEDTRKGAAQSSALYYVEAIEKEVVGSSISGTRYEDKEDYTYDEIGVDIKGTVPTAGRYQLENGIVKNAVFCIGGYIVNYSDGRATAGDKCNEESLKYEGSVKLSLSYENYTYPNSGTFEVIENISGGELSCSSSDTDIATCSISGTTVTVTPGTKEGAATLTVTSSSTSKYKEAKAVHVATTIEGLLSYTANGYDGVYDGEEHGITVTSSEAIIKYGTEEGVYNLEQNPKYTEVGEYTTYYEITKAGYKTIKGSKQVKISQADGEVTLENNKGNIPYNKVVDVEITKNKSNGELETTSSSELIATSEITDNTLHIHGIDLGDAIITVKSKETKNYKEATVDYEATVVKANNELTLSSSFGTLTYPSTGTFTVTKNTSGGELGCLSSDTSIATCSITGNTITVSTGTTKGTATITVNSKETANYNAGQAAYVIITEHALVSYTATGYNGIYDGEEHGISVTSSGATITYSDIADGIYTENKPTYSEVGVYTTYFKVEKEGYTVNSGSKTITITKAEGSINAPTAKTLTYTGSAQTLINVGSSSTGTIQYKLDNGEYTENIPTAIDPGDYTVYYRVIGDNNHFDVEEKSISVTIHKATIQYTAGDYNGVYDGEGHSITLESIGATITYGTERGNYTLTEKPIYIEAGSYTIYYKITREGYFEVEGSNTVTIAKANNTLKISKTTGTLTYPNTDTFEVIENTSGGTLTCESDDTEAVTCSVSGNTITLTPGTKEADSVTITVTSAETNNYKDGRVAYVVTNQNGLLSINANGYTGTYDGKEHGITVTSSEATVKYGTVAGTYDLTSSPTRTDVGTTTVYYQVTEPGYKTVTGSKDIVITKAVGSVSAPTAIPGLRYTGIAQALINAGSSSTGTIQYSLDNITYSTSIPAGTNVGTYTVYYRVVGDNAKFQVETGIFNKKV